MSKPADAIMAALTGNLAGRTEWDELPCLYFIRMFGGEATLRPVPVAEQWWTMGPPADVLANVAAIATESAAVLRSSAPDSMCGIAFYTETWMVISEAGTAQQSEAAVAAGKRRLYQHPDRIEARCLYAVDRTGATYSAVLKRGETAAIPNPVRELKGDVMDLLDVILTAFLDVSLPPRAFRKGR